MELTNGCALSGQVVGKYWIYWGYFRSTERFWIINNYHNLDNRDDVEIVHCNGDYGHDYPFDNELEPYIGGTRILWNFMKNHKKGRKDWLENKWYFIWMYKDYEPRGHKIVYITSFLT